MLFGSQMRRRVLSRRQKIFECKYLEKIIDEAVKTYKTDLASYQSDKTDENAEKVLTDLDFIKALRLYGEKAAYGSMSAQMESLIGEVLGGGMTKEYLDRRYQSMVDAFLGCTFNPVSNHKLVLSSGDVLNIMNNDDAKKRPVHKSKNQMARHSICRSRHEIDGWYSAQWRDS